MSARSEVVDGGAGRRVRSGRSGRRGRRERSDQRSDDALLLQEGLEHGGEVRSGDGERGGKCGMRCGRERSDGRGRRDGSERRDGRGS